jgi:hypothetical protein
VRFPIVPVFLAAAFAVPFLVRAATPPTPSRPTPAPAFRPLRVTTETLTAVGPGTVEAPFSFKTKTGILTAVGPGTTEPPFKPVRIRTDALTAQGAGAGGPK